ncbi:MAG: GAF domain-containing protein [Candidatus Latescibacteria bacterium]|nr:GAF domain-containing protein [Candidatus Latescibacterota bacterium]
MWYGTIHLAHREPGVYSPRHADFLSAVAHQVAAHLQRGSLYNALSAELKRGRERITAFQAAAANLVLEEDVEAALAKLVETARILIDGQRGVLAVWNAEGEVVRYVPSAAPAGDESQQSTLPSGQDLASLFKGTREHFRLVDVSERRELRREIPPRTVSGTFVAAPILEKNESIGVLYLGGKEHGDGFSEDDERLLNLFAVVSEVMLRNADLYGIVTDEQKTLSAIVASMTEGLVVLDQAGRVRVWNGAVARITGVSESPLLGKSVLEIKAAIANASPPSDALVAVLDVLAGNPDPRHPTELTLDRPKRQVEARVFRARLEPQKSLTGLLLRDVTSERELEQRRDAFVSIASHELRTPMTTILGFTELLLKRKIPETTAQEWLTSIYEDSKRLTSIVDDLLNVSRLQSGKIPINLQPVSIGAVVSKVLRAVGPTTEKHFLVTHVPEDLPDVLGDAEKVGQVLMNLLTNAIKYSPKGGRVTVDARHEPIRQRVVVGVQDQGIGIASEDLAQLFTSFHRIRRGDTEGIGGTGLGLYIVRALVELMKGEVWVESELGKGSTFSFTLPTCPTGFVRGGVTRRFVTGGVYEQDRAGRR